MLQLKGAIDWHCLLSLQLKSLTAAFKLQKYLVPHIPLTQLYCSISASVELFVQQSDQFLLR